MKNKVDTLLKGDKVMLYQIVVGTDPGALYLKMTTSPDKGYKIIGSGEAAGR